MWVRVCGCASVCVRASVCVCRVDSVVYLNECKCATEKWNVRVFTNGRERGREREREREREKAFKSKVAKHQ